ncbi:hypothetical protein R3W88_022629 [Solanum pinnatisectum]|uniref:DUF7745 domain-containing protein n=1 Tax=Solanum pinnatisectum TaxID=50273 RepID=A0AAV9LV41_9SOLN|nr:hypothetical protein R3W88_022629 [Solanum pinnatisectum]
MHQFRRTEIFKHLGFLTDIMNFSPNRDLIEALIPFWDSTNNVFCFSNFDLMPTLEELGGFIGLGKDLKSKTLIAPRSNGQHLPTWEKHRQEAFMVPFLATMFFRGEIKISISLLGTGTVMMKKKKFTILPMMLADIYRALTKFREGKDFFEGCSILLRMCFLEHLYRHRFATNFKFDWMNYILSHPNKMKELVDKLPRGVKGWIHYLCKLTASDITWYYHLYPSSEVIFMSSYRPFFVLTGLRRFQPYIPLLVLHRLGHRQTLPKAKDTQSFVWEVAFEDLNRESQNILGGSRTLSLKAMVDDYVQGEADLPYLLQNQLKASMERERDMEKCSTSYQAEVATKRNKWWESMMNFITKLKSFRHRKII